MDYTKCLGRQCDDYGITDSMLLANVMVWCHAVCGAGEWWAEVCPHGASDDCGSEHFLIRAGSIKWCRGETKRALLIRIKELKGVPWGGIVSTRFEWHPEKSPKLPKLTESEIRDALCGLAVGCKNSLSEETE